MTKHQVPLGLPGQHVLLHVGRSSRCRPRPRAQEVAHRGEQRLVTRAVANPAPAPRPAVQGRFLPRHSKYAAGVTQLSRLMTVNTQGHCVRGVLERVGPSEVTGWCVCSVLDTAAPQPPPPCAPSSVTLRVASAPHTQFRRRERFPAERPSARGAHASPHRAWGPTGHRGCRRL